MHQVAHWATWFTCQATSSQAQARASGAHARRDASLAHVRTAHRAPAARLSTAPTTAALPISVVCLAIEAEPKELPCQNLHLTDQIKQDRILLRDQAFPLLIHPDRLNDLILS